MIQVDGNKNSKMEAGLDWLLVQDGGGVSSCFEPIQTCFFSLKIHFESVGGDGDTPPLTKGKDSSVYITHSTVNTDCFVPYPYRKLERRERLDECSASYSVYVSKCFVNITIIVN